MPQKQVAIVGHNNTQAQVTGQNELLVKINSAGSSGLATEATLLDVEVDTTAIAADTAVIAAVDFATETTLLNVDNNIANIVGNTDGVLRSPNLLRTSSLGNLSSVATKIYSVSVANVGIANGTVLGATIKPGEVLNFDASSLNHYFNSFAYDSTSTEFIIIYIS